MTLTLGHFERSVGCWDLGGHPAADLSRDIYIGISIEGTDKLMLIIILDINIIYVIIYVSYECVNIMIYI